LRIQRTSQGITIAVTVLSVLAIALALWSRYYRITQEKAFEARRQMFNYTEQLAAGSDRLTTSVRAYAATGDLRHFQAFQKELNIDRNRDLAVAGLRQLGLTAQEEELLRAAKANSDNLVHLEKQAFAAVDQKDMPKAIQIVFGTEYETAKASIMGPIAEVRSGMEARLTNHAAELAWWARLLTNISLTLLVVNAAAMIGALLMFYRRRVVNPLAALNQSLSDLAERRPGAQIGYQRDNSEVGEVARSMEKYRITVDQAEQQHWVKSSLAEVADAIQGAQEPDEFGRRVLAALVPLVGGGCGAFYVLNEADGPAHGRYHFTSGYGVGAGGEHSVEKGFAPARE